MDRKRCKDCNGIIEGHIFKNEHWCECTIEDICPKCGTPFGFGHRIDCGTPKAILLNEKESVEAQVVKSQKALVGAVEVKGKPGHLGPLKRAPDIVINNEELINFSDEPVMD